MVIYGRSVLVEPMHWSKALLLKIEELILGFIQIIFGSCCLMIEGGN